MMNSAAAPPIETCPNCSTSLLGSHCLECGQKKVDANEYSVQRFIGRAINDFTDLESNKVFRTLSAMILRPGLLAAEYLAGRMNATFQFMNRFILSCALMIAFSAIALANAPDVRFTSGRSALNIPFKLLNNHIYLQVSVNDAKPLWFLLDTGANNILNLRHARTLGLKLTHGGQTTGMGEGLADFFTTDNVSFSLPGVTVGPDRFGVLSLENVEECLHKIDVDAQGHITPRTQAAGEKEERVMDGVLGTEFFRLFVVEIDYVTKTINLHDPEKYRYHGEGERIPLEIRQKYMYMRAPVTPSTHSLPGLFIIDSGSAVALMLNSPFVEQHKLLPPPDQTTPFQVCGIGGDSQTQIGKVSELRLGNIKLENVITMFSQAKNGQLARTDFNGNIGNAILRRFRVVFDYSGKVMILERVKG